MSREATADHARRVKNNLLGQPDLETTCQQCRKRRRGTLQQLMEKPCEHCGYTGQDAK